MKKGDKRPSLFSLKGYIKTGGGHHCPVERGLVIYRGGNSFGIKYDWLWER